MWIAHFNDGTASKINAKIETALRQKEYCEDKSNQGNGGS